MGDRESLNCQIIGGVEDVAKKPETAVCTVGSLVIEDNKFMCCAGDTNEAEVGGGAGGAGARFSADKHFVPVVGPQGSAGPPGPRAALWHHC